MKRFQITALLLSFCVILGLVVFGIYYKNKESVGKSIPSAKNSLLEEKTNGNLAAQETEKESKTEQEQTEEKIEEAENPLSEEKTNDNAAQETEKEGKTEQEQTEAGPEVIYSDGSEDYLGNRTEDPNKMPSKEKKAGIIRRTFSNIYEFLISIA